MKYTFRLIVLTSLFISSLFSISIELDGTQELISGSDCSAASYRFGTTASYGGKDLDIILDVTSEDNDYNPNTCVDTLSNVVSFHIRDKDYYNNMAYMNLKFTVVEKGTLTPVFVDMLTATNFDLDSNPSYTSTDDVYYKNPLQTLISNDSEVSLTSGNYYNNYTTKLKGKDNGNCNDSATLTELSCRAGAIWKNSASIESRVQNDNAYGTISTNYSNNDAHRLIQFSFEYNDIAPLINENNSTQDCGDSKNYSTTGSEWIEGATHSTYNNNLSIQKTINIENAQQLEITINGELEDNYDFLYIVDNNGNSHAFTDELENEKLIIDGSSVTLQLVTDYSVTKEGITINVKPLGCTDTRATVSISSDVNITEGDSGTKPLTFNIELDKPAPNGGITLQIEPHNGTATEGEDFTRNTSSIFIAEGDSSATISYLINGDTDVEDNETFTVSILANDNIILGDSNATGTIINDDQDTPPQLIADYHFDECFWNGTAGEVKDSVGTANGISKHGATTSSEHIINRGAKFKSNNNQYVNIDGFDNIFGTSSSAFTVTAWIKPKTLSNSQTNHNTKNTFFAKASDSKNDNIEIGVNPDGTLHLYLDTESNDTYADFGNNGDINTDTWHFIAVSYQEGEVKVQIDDKNYTNTSIWSEATSIDQAIGSPLTIGASIHIDNYFDGDIDEVKIFENALSFNQSSDIRTNELLAKNWNGTTRDEVDCAIQSVGCIESAFMFQNKPTDINVLNLANGNMVLLKDNISNDNINALGFNKKDGYFWGYNYTKKNGTVTRIGMDSQGVWRSEDFKVDGLNGFKSYVGDIDNNGHLYLKKSGSSKKVVVIDLDPNSLTYLTKLREFNLDFSLGTADWGFNPIDNNLYAVNSGNGTKYLYKINPITGEQLDKQDTGLTDNRGFGASFFDANGFYYVYDNGTGEIFRIDVAHSPNAVLFATGGVVSLNDGAMCTDAEFKFDFGDLPENYPTKLENDGARHSLPTYGEPEIYLGSGVSSENNGKPSTDANLDESDDGVKVGSSTLQDKTIEAGDTTTLTISTHGAGYLSGWIDWNRDGDFNDSSEQIATNIDGSSGEITLNITAPSSAVNRATYARFRYSTTQNLLPIGMADDGEVEDYAINIHGNLEPFTCTDKLYLSNRSELGTGSTDSGATWLHSIVRPSFAYAPIGSGFVSDNGGYNAIGYNTQDNFIYGMYGTHLVKIDKNGLVQDLGEVQELNRGQLYAGEFDREGYYYISGGGGADDKMYKIDIAQKAVIQTITLSSAVRFWDMAIDTTNQYFYAMLVNNKQFVKIDKNSGTITPIGNSHNDELTSDIDIIFSDAEDKVVALAHNGGFYEITTNDGALYPIHDSPSLTFYNDGTSCADANITLPPHPPRLSINNVTKLEGDSGITNFNFTVSIDADLPMMPFGMPSIFRYRVVDGDGNEITPPHQPATSSDNDFEPESGFALDFDIFSNSRTHTITVPVYGDTKVEADEEFYVEIYFPNPNLIPMSFCQIGKSRGVGTIINDDIELNIQRVGADRNDSDLYTQIVGRDFNYAIVNRSDDNFNLGNSTFKIELFDRNISTDTLLYRGYYHTEDENKNIYNVLLDSDLNISRATRDAQFRVSFLMDENGTIKGDFTNEEAYDGNKTKSGVKEIINDSLDHFAIRPESYTIAIKEKDENNNSVTYDTSSLLNLVAGHNYQVKANATQYSSQEKALKYTQNSTAQLDSQLIFDDKVTCNDDSNRSFNYKFTDGTFTKTLSHNNYGKYNLKIVDSNWTEIDQENGDCILDSNATSNNGDSKSGCNIESEEVALKFMPHHFNIDSSLANANHNGKDYLYMSDLTLSQKMGVELNSTIVAQGEDGTQLSNFTKSCIDSNINLNLGLQFSFISDEGESNNSHYTTPKSIPNMAGERTTLVPQQIVYFNNDNNKTVEHIQDINIQNKFLDENNGSIEVDILYNMEKLFTKPTNPIKVTFKSLDLNSSNLEAKIENKNNKPSGKGEIDKQRIYYFARVASYRKNYPPTTKKEINTPLFVEIFCKKIDDEDWCQNTMKINNKSNRRGWYFAKDHNSSSGEGRVFELISDDNSTVRTTPDSPIPDFINGRVDSIVTKYISNSELSDKLKVEIAIDSDVWLRFNKKILSNVPLGTSSYSVTFKNLSSTTGAGDTGNLVESVKKVEKNGKMSW